jgi:hypothetical protein
MRFQLLHIMALNNRAQLLSADAETSCLDIGGDLVLTRWSNACGIKVVVRLMIEENDRSLNYRLRWGGTYC